MANLNYIYQTGKDIAQKEGRGWIPSNQFNNYIVNVQFEVFQDIYQLYTQALRQRRAYLDYNGFRYSSIHQIKDDLRPLYRDNVSLSQISANEFSYPSDYMYIEGLDYNDTTVDLRHTGEDISYILKSSSAPTTTYPLGVLGYDNITMYPTSITSGVKMSYYKIPQGIDSSGNPITQDPTWASETINGEEIYNASNSVQLELPESTYNKIIVRLLQRIGITIREPELSQYAQTEEQKNQGQY